MEAKRPLRSTEVVQQRVDDSSEQDSSGEMVCYFQLTECADGLDMYL